MRMPITEVRVGMVIIEAYGNRSVVTERGSWCPASGGPPWVQLRLRRRESCGLTLSGYSPDVDVDVDLTTVTGLVEPPEAL
jgi:hypothetical protein